MAINVTVRVQDHSGREAISRRHVKDMSNSGHQYLRLKINKHSQQTETYSKKH